MAPTANNDNEHLKAPFAQAAAPSAEQALALIADMQARGVPHDLILRTISLVSGQQKTIQELQNNARINKMTGLHSAAALEEEFPHMQAALKRANHDLPADKRLVGCMLFADMIDLSQLNKYGHDIGDNGIIASARELKKICHREGDMAVRLHTDGDEFALVFPAVHPDFARTKLAAEMQAAQQLMNVQTPAGVENIGIRYHTVSFTEADSLADVLKRADPKDPQNKANTISLRGVANDMGRGQNMTPPAAPGASIA